MSETPRVIEPNDIRDEAKPSSVRVMVTTLLLPAAAIGAVLMSSYLRGSAVAPAGFDTPYYVWRSNLVISGGLESLTGMMTTTARTNVSRLGFPTFAAVVHGVTGIQPMLLTYVLPSILAIVIGFAGGAFALGVLGERRKSFPFYVVGLGLSAMVVRTATGPFDNLIVDALVMQVLPR
jgi:hypothetical protein